MSVPPWRVRRSSVQSFFPRPTGSTSDLAVKMLKVVDQLSVETREGGATEPLVDRGRIGRRRRRVAGVFQSQIPPALEIKKLLGKLTGKPFGKKKLGSPYGTMTLYMQPAPTDAIVEQLSAAFEEYDVSTTAAFDGDDVVFTIDSDLKAARALFEEGEPLRTRRGLRRQTQETTVRAAGTSTTESSTADTPLLSTPSSLREALQAAIETAITTSSAYVKLTVDILETAKSDRLLQVSRFRVSGDGDEEPQAGDVRVTVDEGNLGLSIPVDELVSEMLDLSS